MPRDIAVESLSVVPLGGRPAVRLVDEDMGVDYVDCNRLRAEDDCFSDPLGGEMDVPQTMRDWKLQMHPKALCQGLGAPKEAYNTITSWLQEIMETDLTHMQLAQQANTFSLSLLAPVPFAKACKAVALHERAKNLYILIVHSRRSISVFTTVFVGHGIVRFRAPQNA